MCSEDEEGGKKKKKKRKERKRRKAGDEGGNVNEMTNERTNERMNEQGASGTRKLTPSKKKKKSLAHRQTPHAPRHGRRGRQPERGWDEDMDGPCLPACAWVCHHHVVVLSPPRLRLLCHHRCLLSLFSVVSQHLCQPWQGCRKITNIPACMHTQHTNTNNTDEKPRCKIHYIRWFY